MSVRYALGAVGVDGGAGVWAAQAGKKRLLPGLVVYAWPVGVVTTTVPSATAGLTIRARMSLADGGID
jgi:hypothetical protein